MGREAHTGFGRAFGDGEHFARAAAVFDVGHHDVVQRFVEQGLERRHADLGFRGREQHALVTCGGTDAAQRGVVRLHFRQRALEPVKTRRDQRPQHPERTALVEAPVAVDHQSRLGADGVAQREHAVDAVGNEALAFAGSGVGGRDAVERGGFEAGVAEGLRAQGRGHEARRRAHARRAVDVGVDRHLASHQRPEQCMHRLALAFGLQTDQSLLNRADRRVGGQATFGRGVDFEARRRCFDLQTHAFGGPALQRRLDLRLAAIQRSLAPANGAVFGVHRDEEPVGLFRNVEDPGPEVGDARHRVP